MTVVRVQRWVDCPFSAVIEFAGVILHDRGDVTVSPVPLVGEHVSVQSSEARDYTDTVRHHEALLLAWQPPHRNLFPNFRGVFTVRPKRGGAWLRLQGEYSPPLGRMGALFDALVGRLVARQTMARFLKEIACAVEHKWRAREHAA